MKQLHVSTSVGVGFLIAAVLLFFYNAGLAIDMLCLAAYFAAMKEVSKYTSWYQFSIVFISAIALGIAIEYPFGKFPFLTIAVFFSACTSITRIVFFKTFGYTSFSWFEPLMLFLTVLTYISGNLINHNNWEGWVLPLPTIIFAGILAYGMFKDEKQLLTFTKGGYRVQIGKPATDFTLPDQDGNMVSLSDFKNKRHLLLVFVRGDWCPGCHMMLRTYEKNRDKFAKKNIQIMAIGPDPTGVNHDMVAKLGVDYKVLSDEGQKTAMVYGVQLSEYDNDFAEKYEAGIPLPASFLIDMNGIVRYVSRPDKVGEFLNPSLIFPIIDGLT